LGLSEDDLSAESGGSGERYDKLARVGRFGLLGVCGGRRLRFDWILGMAGVGAPIAATGAKSKATSSASLSSSSLFPSEICDIFPALLDEAVVVDLDLSRKYRADGDGEFLSGEASVALAFSACAERASPSFALRPVVFGVEPLGVEILGVTLLGCNDRDEELDDGGRGNGVVLTILFGREGDPLDSERGVTFLGFEGVVGGVIFTEFVRLAFKAAR